MEPSTTCVLLVNHNLEALGNPFDVCTPRRIRGLNEKVKEKRQNALAYVDAAWLTVWRCTDPTTVFDDIDHEMLNRQVKDLFLKQKVKQLGGNQTIAQLNILEEETLLVKMSIVGPPASIPAKRKFDELEYHTKVQSRTVTNTQPSKLNDYKMYSELQKNKSEKILDGRADDIDVPPLSLLHRGFGLFFDSIEPGIISDFEKNDVDHLVEVVRQIESEEEKRGKVEDILRQILFPGGAPFKYLIKGSSQRATDGHVLAANGGPLFIVEYKQEMRTAEPQLAAYFIQLAEAAQGAMTQIFRGWRQPCLGMIIRGEYISFLGFVMVDAQVRMLPLTPAFPCNKYALQSRAPLYAAFSAAKDLLTTIEKDAKDFVESPQPENQAPIPHRFPYVQSLRQFPSDSQQEQRINFRITESLGDGVEDRFLYLADIVNTESKPILVKFSRTYCIELHQFCALRNYTPQLLAFEELPGGWFGIAMEYLSSAIRLDESPSLLEYGTAWLENMEEIVETLHQHGYVHGDLRAPNFLVNEERLLLIDFDWGGKEGQATFPDAQLLPILRAGRHEKLIQKDHDKKVLAYTKEVITQKMRGLSRAS